MVSDQCEGNMLRNHLGRDLALIFVYTPVQFVLCVVLLYRILSWSK